MEFKFSLKMPNIDPLFVRQTKALKSLHEAAIELTTKLFNSRNPQEAYDPDEGGKHIREFVAMVRTHTLALKPPRIARILRRRSQGATVYKNELDRDIVRSEVFQQNIEYEIFTLCKRKMLFYNIVSLIVMLSGFGTLTAIIIKAMVLRGAL